MVAAAGADGEVRVFRHRYETRFAGGVASRSIEPGSTVAPGIPGFQLVQTRVVRAIAPVPENQVARIRGPALAPVARSVALRSACHCYLPWHFLYFMPEPQ